MGQTIGRLPTKRALAAAKWSSQYLMTVSSDHFLLPEPGDSFRSPVKKEDPSIFVVSNDTFHEVVKDLLQVSFVG